MIKWVDQMLWEWADWAGRDDAGIGYPRESTVGRVMREGPSAGHGRGWQPTNMPLSVERVEQAVLRMPADLRHIVKQRYTEPGTPEQQARKMRISVRAYRDRLDRAHYFLAGSLDVGAA